MLTAELFYCTFWVTAISIVWFFTDTLFYYSKLLGIFENLMLEYAAYANKHKKEKLFFTDFLFSKALNTESSIKKFLLKVSSCVFCLPVWFSIAASALAGNLMLAAPVYVLSLIMLLKIKSWI